MSDHVPSYRRKRTNTGIYAVVTIPDGAGGRRDLLLGKYGTKQSRQEYARVIAEWETNGRRLPTATASDLTINELALAYWQHAEKHYQKPAGVANGELHCLQSALRPLKLLYGPTTAANFGPLALKTVRQQMIETKAPNGRFWARGFVNASIGRIRAMFKWGVENEIISPTVLHGLQAVRGLQRGRTEAREAEPIKPVPVAFVDATLPHVPSPVRAMIRLQLLTAMRPGEIVIMRGIDLNMTGRIWFYNPQYHKTAWRGHARAIAIGPQAQTIIREFLTTDLQAYLFSPKQAMLEWRQRLRLHRKSRVQPSQLDRSKRKPQKQPGDHYTPNTFRNAVHRGCAKADKLAHRQQPGIPADQIIVPEWNPNQLRHTRATELRREFGLDAARVILGHRSLAIVETYAEVDAAAAEKIMLKIG